MLWEWMLKPWVSLKAMGHIHGRSWMWRSLAPDRETLVPPWLLHLVFSSLIVLFYSKAAYTALCFAIYSLYNAIK